MYREASYQDVAGEIAAELKGAMALATARGVAEDSLILDPGIGFAKLPAHSFEALARIDRLAALGRPLLVGPSRKSFLTAAIGSRPPDGREWATASAVAIGAVLGAHIVRVHGVREMVDAVRVADRLREALG
jgi:dihydropteroate synthase